MATSDQTEDYDREQYSVLVAIARGAIRTQPRTTEPEPRRKPERLSLGELDRSGKFMH